MMFVQGPHTDMCRQRSKMVLDTRRLNSDANSTTLKFGQVTLPLSALVSSSL